MDNAALFLTIHTRYNALKNQNVFWESKAKSKPNVYVKQMIQSLAAMERTQSEAGYMKDEEAQFYVAKGYATAKVKKLTEYATMSTKWRNKLAEFFVKTAPSSAFQTYLAENIPENLEEVWSNECFPILVRFGLGRIRQVIMSLMYPKLREYCLGLPQADFTLYLDTIAKVGFKINMAVFRPKKYTLTRGSRLYQVMPLYSYQQRHIPVSLEGFWYILNSCKKLHPNGMPDLPGRDDFTLEVALDWYWKIFDFSTLNIKSLEVFRKRNFTGSFSTDGVSIDFHVNKIPPSVENDEPPLVDMDIDVENIDLNYNHEELQETQSQGPSRVPAKPSKSNSKSKSKSKSKTNTKGNPKAKRAAKKQSKEEFDKQESKRLVLKDLPDQEELEKTAKVAARIKSIGYDPQFDHVWAIDPGKTNIFTAVDSFGEGAHQIREFTAKEFNHESGHNRFMFERYSNDVFLTPTNNNVETIGKRILPRVEL